MSALPTHASALPRLDVDYTDAALPALLADDAVLAVFGFGPRASAHGLYSATLDPMQQIRVRRMQTMRVVVTTQDGRRTLTGSAVIALMSDFPPFGGR